MPWFGLYLPQLRMPWERIVERTQAAETAGFDSLWLMDHLVAPQAREGRAEGGADRRGGAAVSAQAAARKAEPTEGEAQP